MAKKKTPRQIVADLLAEVPAGHQARSSPGPDLEIACRAFPEKARRIAAEIRRTDAPGQLAELLRADPVFLEKVVGLLRTAGRQKVGPPSKGLSESFGQSLQDREAHGIQLAWETAENLTLWRDAGRLLPAGQGLEAWELDIIETIRRGLEAGEKEPPPGWPKSYRVPWRREASEIQRQRGKRADLKAGLSSDFYQEMRRDIAEELLIRAARVFLEANGRPHELEHVTGELARLRKAKSRSRVT